MLVCAVLCHSIVLKRELLLDDVAVTAAVRPTSLEKANSIFSDKKFFPEGALSLF